MKDIFDDYVVNGRRLIADLKRRVTLHLTPVFSGRTLSSITTGDSLAFAACRRDIKAARASNGPA